MARERDGKRLSCLKTPGKKSGRGGPSFVQGFVRGEMNRSGKKEWGNGPRVAQLESKEERHRPEVGGEPQIACDNLKDRRRAKRQGEILTNKTTKENLVETSAMTNIRRGGDSPEV